jgi:hypothetical protein
MAGFARGSRANAVIFFISPGGVSGDAGKIKRGCHGEIGRAVRSLARGVSDAVWAQQRQSACVRRAISGGVPEAGLSLW